MVIFAGRMVTLILLILLLLIFSAFFSGAEIAFITANKLGVEIERDKGTRRSKLITSFYNNPKQLLSTLVVGNSIILVLFAYCMTLLLDPLFEPFIRWDGVRLLLIILITTLIILVLGEYFPKILFRAYANKAVALVSYPLAIFQWIMKIPVWIVMSIANLLIKYIFRAPVDNVTDAFTRLDLQDYVEGSINKENDELEAVMFKNALQLKNVKVRECMVPRTEIVHVDVHDGLDELKRIFTETRHSRILITDGGIDNILGYAHHQTFLQNQVTLDKMVMPVRYVPKVTSVLEVMTMFTRQKSSMAVVVDEYGGTAGIITLEDIAEEIFGEIEDEHDVETFIDKKISPTEFLFSGRLEIDYLNDKYPELKLPEGEYETLSGYIVMTSGEIPEKGKDFEMDNHRFVIEKVTDKKIEEVRVFLVNTED